MSFYGKIAFNLKTSFRRFHYNYTRFFSRFEKDILLWGKIIDTLAGIASAVCIVCLIVYAGYNLNESDRNMTMSLLRVAQIIFGINIVYQVVIRFRANAHYSRFIKWVVDLLIVLSFVAWILPDMQHPWLPIIKKLLFSKKFLFTALGLYSLVDLSYALSRVPSRRTNPSVLMALSFLFFILIGSFVLMLPRCTYNGISYFDSLFIASSAVCITGLSTVDIPSTFTPFGILTLSVLVQLGSLGIITFTSFFAMFFTGGTSIYNQLLLKDIIYSKSMNSLVPTLLYVLGFTLVIELLGAVCVFFTVPEALDLSFNDKLIFSAFHSMSSFCNAGFSCLPDGMSNQALLHSNQNIYIITSILIFAGAIGFPILVNFKEILKHYFIKLFDRIRKIHNNSMPIHIYDLNTKIVLYTTLIVLAVGSASFFLLEYNNSLRNMSLYEKIVQSVFNSLTPRSAGFASLNPTSFLDITLLIIVVQMIIGGSSQSMAGGIKVNTIGTLFLSLKSVLYGHEATSAFNRTINQASVRRANAVLLLAAATLLIYTCIILYLEPQISTKSAMFEVVSAVFTVGSSLGATSQLGDASKVVLSTAMFFGRVGIISFLCGIIGSRRDVSPYLPTDNVIIN